MEDSGTESHWPGRIQASDGVVQESCPGPPNFRVLIHVTAVAMASIRAVSGTDELMCAKQQEKWLTVSVARS